LKSIFNLFRPNPKIKSEDRSKLTKGYEAFEKGKKLLKNKQDDEALKLFDKAIEFGFTDEVYEYRGICLQSLDYDLDAIEDFDRAIAKLSENASLYFSRSLSKSNTGDLKGCVSDLEMAVNLSKIDNEINKNYEMVAKELGWNSATDKYNLDLQNALQDLEWANEQCNWPLEKKESIFGKEKWTYPHWKKINKKRRFVESNKSE
jgi:tetratricopeptide (TPR) repeat protein